VRKDRGVVAHGVRVTGTASFAGLTSGTSPAFTVRDVRRVRKFLNQAQEKHRNALSLKPAPPPARKGASEVFSLGYAWNELRRRWGRTLVTAFGLAAGSAS